MGLIHLIHIKEEPWYSGKRSRLLEMPANRNPEKNPGTTTAPNKIQQ